MDVLVEIFLELNEAHFAGSLPLPRLLWNSRLAATAGRFCPGSRNLLRPRPPEIEVATYLRELPDGLMHVRDTVLHEMIHYFLWHRNRPYGHTTEFRQIMHRVGAKRYNPVPKLRAVKYWYECPGCLKRVPARRRIRDSACLVCCKKHNGGYYSERFRLRLLDAAVAAQIPLSKGAPSVPTASAPPSPFPAPSAPNAARKAEAERSLSPEEIIRRLEELKTMLVSRKTSS